MMKFPTTLQELIKRESLDDLIGKTHEMILRSLIKENKCASEIFEEINGMHEVSAFTQVVRATDQLVRINCVLVVGKKKAKCRIGKFEPIYSITELGRVLLHELQKSS